MIQIQNIGAQGDVLFRRVDKLPAGAVQQKAKGKIVVAHSETGHHHSIIDAMRVSMFEIPENKMICYLRIDAEHADVVHERPFDTHETMRLLGDGSVWEIRRQREWAPEGWRQIQD